MVEVFVEGTEPKEQSKIYKKVKIDKRNKLLAKDSCLSQFIEEKIFIDYPPEVYSWAVENKQEVIPNRFSPWCDESWEYSAQSLLEITYPREKTVFEYAPELISNQAIVFEANVSQDISQISWFVDGTLIGMPVDFPFKVSWALRIGKHTIKAIGKTAENKEITSKEVNISPTQTSKLIAIKLKILLKLSIFHKEANSFTKLIRL